MHGEGTVVPATAIRWQGLGCGEHGDDQLEEGLGEQGIGTGCLVVWLADGARLSGLMDPTSGDSKLKHRTELQAAMWGR